MESAYQNCTFEEPPVSAKNWTTTQNCCVEDAKTKVLARNVRISRGLLIGITIFLFMTTLGGFGGVIFMVSKLPNQLDGVGQFNNSQEIYNGTCFNNGSFVIESNQYKCLCTSGFYGKRCEIDFNECTGGTHNCHQQATCANTVGSFECSCNANYTGDGRLCKANFCSDNVGLCKHNGTCLDTFTAYNCSCNRFYTGEHCERELVDHVIMTTERNWTDARKYCKSIGGDLATWGMRNATVRNWIVKTLLRPRTRPANYWIGLTDREHEGVWKYIDGVPVTTANTDFHPGEPNDLWSADCGLMNYAYKFKMDDLPCGKTNMLAICERLRR